MNNRFSCLVLMSFQPAYAAVYATIRNAAHEIRGVECHRLDDIYRPGSIPDDIMQHLRSADFCIADLTEWNANVMWEVGYAMARETPVIAIAAQGQELPFNVSVFRTVFYDPANLKTLHDQLPRAIQATLRHLTDHREMIAYLKKTIPMRDRQEAINRFKREGMIVRLLLDHHLARYAGAVAKAKHDILPLPSAQRLEIATDAIQRAKRDVRAITDLANDQWQKPGSAYLEANRQAAANGVTVRRIVLVPENPGSIPQERHDAIRSQRQAGVQAEYAYAHMLRERFGMTGEDYTHQNLLIVDKTLMARSGEASHDGEIHLNPHDIEEGIAQFDRLWAHVCLNPARGPWDEEPRTATISSATTEVAIIGAGAVGVNAAVFLSRLGIGVELLDDAETILQGGPRACFINHGDGFEYYKSGHRRTGEYCIDGAFTKGLIYPIRLFATPVCDRDNPMRFFVSKGSIAAGYLTLGDFVANAASMQRYFTRQFEAVRASRGWNLEEMEGRFLRTPGTFVRSLQPGEYEDVANVAGGCAGSSFGINMPHYYAYLMAAMARVHVSFRPDTKVVAIEHANGFYRITTSGGTITARQVLFAAGHRNATLIGKVHTADVLQAPAGTYFLNAMTFMHLPACEDETRRKMARRINFTLQQDHGAMFACIVAPSDRERGMAAVYRPTELGSQLRAYTVRTDAPTGDPPAEWDDLIANGLPPDDVHVVETLRRARELYPVLADAEISHTICRPVFNVSTADSNKGLDRRVREIAATGTAVVPDGSISAWAAPKWTNAELVALMACDHVHEKLRGTRLPNGGQTEFGPTRLDIAEIARTLELRDLSMRRDDALRYALNQKLPLSIVTV